MQSNSSNSSLISSYEAYITNITNQFIYYFVIVSSVIGISGNLLSMVIFIRLTFKNTKINMGLLYTCQTIIDLITLILTLLVFRGSVFIFGINILTISDSYCRAFGFLRRYTLHASVWMSVLISFDRFTFVLYEQRFRFMKNKLILFAIIFGVMLLIAIVDIENLFYYLAVSSKTGVFSCTLSDQLSLASDIISMFLRTYIPMILMAVFNGLVIYQLFKRSKSSNLVQNQNNSLKRKEHQFTIAVMSCNILFFLTNFPYSIFYIPYDIEFYSGVLKRNSTLSAIYTLVLNIIISVAFVSQICSIFMYLAFNKLFRKEFTRIFLFFLSCKVFMSLKSETSVTNSVVVVKRNGQASFSGRN